MNTTGTVLRLIISLSAFFLLSWNVYSQQSIEEKWKPLAQVQHEDYALARTHLKTKLFKRDGSPEKSAASDSADVPPPGAKEILFRSGALTLKAWMNEPNRNDLQKKYPAVVFLHGGYSFGKGDWDMTKPFRDSGFIVITPMLRGENGQEGTFTLFYDEVDDAIAATAYLRNQPYIDTNRVFLAGHSVGAIITMLTAETSRYFRKAASFSGPPDLVLFYKYVIDPKLIPFDTLDVTELQMRSPLAYAESFKCPIRIFYGTKEPYLAPASKETSSIAKKKGIDATSIEVEGGHMSAVDGEMKLAIQFFNQQ